MNTKQKKISYEGEIIAVQPRSNVWRYRLDNRTHSHIGYNLFLKGNADGEEREFVIAISEKQQEKYKFHIGDVIKGTGWTKLYPQLEYADYYRVGGLKKILSAPNREATSAPWNDEVPALSVYEWRGCRMLDKRVWSSKCKTCKWACMANVAIEYDWGISQKFRFESFCYGQKNCKYYKMGKPRAVPYKNCGSSYDEGWLDEICTERRGLDE
ncbi:MAG: hypothetical protein KBT48_00675 [Firmicutes bacterium]|nr:hypothetical protein [Bacillota bacterium]